MERLVWIIQIGPMQSQKSFQKGSRRIKVRERLEKPAMLILKMKEGAYEPRNSGNFSKQEKAREQLLPKSLQEEHSPARTLILTQ